MHLVKDGMVWTIVKDDVAGGSLVSGGVICALESDDRGSYSY